MPKKKVKKNTENNDKDDIEFLNEQIKKNEIAKEEKVEETIQTDFKLSEDEIMEKLNQDIPLGQMNLEPQYQVVDNTKDLEKEKQVIQTQTNREKLKSRLQSFKNNRVNGNVQLTSSNGTKQIIKTNPFATSDQNINDQKQGMIQKLKSDPSSLPDILKQSGIGGDDFKGIIEGYAKKKGKSVDDYKEVFDLIK